MRLSALSPTLFPLILSLLSGCSPKEEPAQQQQPSMVRDYHQDAKPILDRYCNGCHSEGGIGHFSLASYSAAKTYSSLIKSQVDSGDMPPWPPAGESLPLRYSRQMAPQDKQILLDWVKDGAQEGDPNAKPRVVIAPPEVPQPPRAIEILAVTIDQRRVERGMAELVADQFERYLGVGGGGRVAVAQPVRRGA